MTRSIAVQLTVRGTTPCQTAAMPTQFESLLYKTDGPVATITLNRPEHLNTIVPPMPDEIETAIGLAERDPNIKVIVLRGAGRAFSGGYDFGGGFHHWDDAMNTDGRWDPGKDFAAMIAKVTSPHQKFLAIWRASKPVIAQVHGWCVGGGSDYALSGEPLTGKEAAAVELINESVPFERLEARVKEVAGKLASIPLSQLQAQKLIVNQAYENMGLSSTQMLGGFLDGLMRNTPDALQFIDTAANQGVRAAIERRDGPWGDYSQAPPERRPDPSHIIEP